MTPRTHSAPAGRRFQERFAGELLELGAVLPYYRHPLGHTVIDKQDQTEYPHVVRGSSLVPGVRRNPGDSASACRVRQG